MKLHARETLNYSKYHYIRKFENLFIKSNLYDLCWLTSTSLQNSYQMKGSTYLKLGLRWKFE